MPAIDELQPDAFGELLTDALRAGPGSPQWHQAVQLLRDRGGSDADQHRLLLEARQHLESGRAYRSIRAGNGFTAKLMSTIDAGPSDGRWSSWLPHATVLAIMSALLVVGAIVGLAYYLTPAASAPSSPAIERLANLYLVDTVESLNFDGTDTIGEWRAVGGLSLSSTLGLRPIGVAPSTVSQTAGGAIVWNQTLDASDPFAVDATLRAPASSDDLIPQIVITDHPDFRQDNATGSHEFVWLLQSDRASVILPGGRIEARTFRLRQGGQPINVRISIDRENAIVETAGKRLWAGAHGLDADAPRTVAIRFLKRSGAGDKPDPGIAFQSVRIQKEPGRDDLRQ